MKILRYKLFADGRVLDTTTNKTIFYIVADRYELDRLYKLKGFAKQRAIIEYLQESEVIPKTSSIVE